MASWRMQFLLGDGGSLAAAALEAEVTMDCLFGGVLLADTVVQLVPWTGRCIGCVLRFYKKIYEHTKTETPLRDFQGGLINM